MSLESSTASRIATKFTVTQETAPKVREWFANGRGARLWKSVEIGNSRPEQLTPGDVTTPPHWAYTLEASEIVTPADISMEIREDIPGEEVRSRNVRHYWGNDIHETGKERARKTCERIRRKTGRDVDWYHAFSECGIAHIRFRFVECVSFAEYCAQ
jgi:hypothetical protein